MIYYAEITQSPIGKIFISGDGESIQRVFLHEQKYAPAFNSDWLRDDICYQGAIEQLQAYFNGELVQFDLPLAPQGTDFQKTVWQALTKIPFGESCSYQQLAIKIGSPKAMRAVGAANGRNPIAIIVPCHRVIGASGKLTGYAGGLERKHWLLQHEQQQKCLFG